MLCILTCCPVGRMPVYPHVLLNLLFACSVGCSNQQLAVVATIPFKPSGLEGDSQTDTCFRSLKKSGFNSGTAEDTN